AVRRERRRQYRAAVPLQYEQLPASRSIPNAGCAVIRGRYETPPIRRVGDGAYPISVAEQREILGVLGECFLEHGQGRRRVRRPTAMMGQNLQNDALALRYIAGPEAAGGRLDEQSAVCFERRIPLGRGDLRLVTRCRQAGGQCEEHDTCNTDGNPVAPGKLAGTIDEAVTPGEDGFAPQVALDVFGERIHGRITLCGVLAQRLQHDGIEVAREYAVQLPRRRAPRVRCRVAEPEAARGNDLLLEDGLFQRSTRIALGSIWPLACQELVEHHAESVDVRGCRDRRAGDLLRRRIVRCQNAATEERELRRVCPAGLGQELGDAEVEQANLAIPAHQDVGRLQIAVDDQ